MSALRLDARAGAPLQTVRYFNTNDHFLTDTTKDEKIEGVSGAAVSGRHFGWRAGTPALPDSFHIKIRS